MASEWKARSVRLPVELWAKIATLAGEHSRTVSHEVLHALRVYVASQERRKVKEANDGSD